MSTIVAVRKNGVAVIGADTLTKYGYTKQHADLIKNHSKIIKVENSYIACVGEAAFGLVLKDYFENTEEKSKLDSPMEIFKTAKKLHDSLKEDYFLTPNDDENGNFESSHLHCLIMNKSGIYALYKRRSVDEFTKYFSFGSGEEYALGAMRTIYDSEATAEEIARAGLEAAAEFDDSTGAPFEIYSLALD